MVLFELTGTCILTTGSAEATVKQQLLHSHEGVQQSHLHI